MLSRSKRLCTIAAFRMQYFMELLYWGKFHSKRVYVERTEWQIWYDRAVHWESEARLARSVSSLYFENDHWQASHEPYKVDGNSFLKGWLYEFDKMIPGRALKSAKLHKSQTLDFVLLCFPKYHTCPKVEALC